MQRTSETLVDTKKNGKPRDWQGKKKRSLTLDELHRINGDDRKAERVRLCAHTLEFDLRSDGSKTLAAGYFCQTRLCPVCSMRRTEKIFGQVSKVMNELERDAEYSALRFIFLTLTVRSVPGKQLPAALDALSAGFHELCRTPAFKHVAKGWFRALEITHNWDTDTYHPHFHVVLAVPEPYLTRKENYITQPEWITIWRRCMKLDYDPSVDVRMVKATSDGPSAAIRRGKAVAEVSKYTVKDSDYLQVWTKGADGRKRYLKPRSEAEYQQITKRLATAVETLDGALHGRRLVAFGGVLKETHKKLNLDDPVDGDLLIVDGEEQREDLTVLRVKYSWNFGIGNYVRATEDEDTDD